MDCYFAGTVRGSREIIASVFGEYSSTVAPMLDQYAMLQAELGTCETGGGLQRIIWAKLNEYNLWPEIVVDTVTPLNEPSAEVQLQLKHLCKNGYRSDGSMLIGSLPHGVRVYLFVKR